MTEKKNAVPSGDGLSRSLEEQVKRKRKKGIFALRELDWLGRGVEETSMRLRRMKVDGQVAKIRKGEFYVPSSPGAPASRDDVISFLCRKLGGYLSGPHAYYRAGIIPTEPASDVPIRIAVRKACRSGTIAGYPFRFVRQYASPRGFPSGLVVALDAIRDAGTIPGTVKIDVLDWAAGYIREKGYSRDDILRCALRFPPRVRAALSDRDLIPRESTVDKPGKGAWRKDEDGLDTIA